MRWKESEKVVTGSNNDFLMLTDPTNGGNGELSFCPVFDHYNIGLFCSVVLK